MANAERLQCANYCEERFIALLLSAPFPTRITEVWFHLLCPSNLSMNWPSRVIVNDRYGSVIKELWTNTGDPWLDVSTLPIFTPRWLFGAIGSRNSRSDLRGSWDNRVKSRWAFVYFFFFFCRFSFSFLFPRVLYTDICDLLFRVSLYGSVFVLYKNRNRGEFKGW